MSLSIKSINGDACFLLTFTPSADTKSDAAGSFTVLTDPWLEGPTHVYHPKFSQTTRIGTSSIASLAELDRAPDVVACSQDKPDHCNKATLTKLAPDCASRFVSTPAATKMIRSWSHFDSQACKALAMYSPSNPDTVFRIALPASSSDGASGEVTISILAPTFDPTGLHNAIGITYRPPLDTTARQSGPQQALSLLYAPHGIPHTIAQTWADTHLSRENALPLTALLHNFDEIDNPWFLGGLIAHGVRQGYTIARALLPRVWVGVHDEEKEVTGLSIMFMRTRKVGVAEVRAKLREDGVDVEGEGRESGNGEGGPEKNGDTTSRAKGNGVSAGAGHNGNDTSDTTPKSDRTTSQRMKVVVLGVGEDLRINS